MRKINWKVRVKNPYFWIQIVAAVFATILGYAGISGSELTTWSKVFELVAMALSNPYCLFLIAVSVWSAINDPTTAGVSDSKQAMNYDAPKED